MNRETATKLISLNNEFYRLNGDSFFATRQSAWPGWSACLELLRAEESFPLDAFSVLDLAAGNMRFYGFLRDSLPAAKIDYYAVDSSDLARGSAKSGHFQGMDILSSLMSAEGEGQGFRLQAPLVDLSVCFGFMHHVPGVGLRKRVMEVLCAQTRPGSVLIVSFWRFMDSPSLAAKARKAHETALEELGLDGLDAGDWLIGWNDAPHTYRYCHSFSEPEIDQLLDLCSGWADCIGRFTADGRSKDLNTYLVLRIRPEAVFDHFDEAPRLV
ncbi:MAG: hypothetical protein FWH40_03925 [Coriobacteriia bacterium]|nr:hypothetical protein [Coriobacteriia bacterium]MCL2136655.1 hypothetical protein [Coriobacteriia bacterium]